jgi:hypothetical protein
VAKLLAHLPTVLLVKISALCMPPVAEQHQREKTAKSFDKKRHSRKDVQHYRILYIFLLIKARMGVSARSARALSAPITN